MSNANVQRVYFLNCTRQYFSSRATRSLVCKGLKHRRYLGYSIALQKVQDNRRKGVIN